MIGALSALPPRLSVLTRRSWVVAGCLAVLFFTTPLEGALPMEVVRPRPAETPRDSGDVDPNTLHRGSDSDLWHNRGVIPGPVHPWREREPPSADAVSILARRLEAERFLSSGAAAGWRYESPGVRIPEPAGGGLSHPKKFVIKRAAPPPDPWKTHDGVLTSRSVGKLFDEPKPVLPGDDSALTSRAAFHIDSSSYSNTIELSDADATALAQADLTPFFEIHNRLLEDIPAPLSFHLDDLHADGHGKATASHVRELSGSHSVVITRAQLTKDQEVVTVFHLADFGLTGLFHGKAFVVAKDQGAQVENDIALYLGEARRARVYLYGGDASWVDLTKIAGRNHKELVRRTADSPHDLPSVEARLQVLQLRSGSQPLTVVNGLPRNEQEVEQMGAYAGDPRLWQEFHDQVDSAAAKTSVQRADSAPEWVHELQEGNSDMVILVAHATGADMYLGGKPISFEALRALPSRDAGARRPRMAVLIACNAGKPQRQGTRAWWNVFWRPSLAPLAQLLVEKGYFDKVVGPARSIEPQESMEVLRQALEGSTDYSKFSGWTNWAVLWSSAFGTRG